MAQRGGRPKSLDIAEEFVLELIPLHKITFMSYSFPDSVSFYS